MAYISSIKFGSEINESSRELSNHEKSLLSSHTLSVLEARMSKLILKFLLTLILLFPELCCGQDSIARGNGRKCLYIEIVGHNFLSYKDDLRPVTSLNFGYTLPLSDVCSVFGSIGWGLYRERYSIQIPWQPATQHTSIINIVPIEVSLRLGKKKHFGEIGGAISQAWGEYRIKYQSSQAASSVRVLKEGQQYIFRVGYTLITKYGVIVRVAISPHFFSPDLNHFNESNIDRAEWIPVGFSLGYTF